ncbi:MAG TPA: ion channel [Terriglobales bacterium]|nr:ion channel [Terriglobales bacterium]
MAPLFRVLLVLAGFALLAFVLRDAFETMILPRRLNGRFRFTQSYYRSFWPLWSGLSRRALSGRRRESALSLFGPLSMLGLFVLWAVALIAGFALVFFGLGSPLQTTEPLRGFGMDFYLSGTMFLTLGLGNAAPSTSLARLLAVAEGGLGFGFVAIIISYLPVLYSSFSHREISISMLDARAGSPPSASELLRRHAGNLHQLEAYLAEWERWSAELLESHISYPVLGYFRSQHVNQSWLAALTTLLDACALLTAATADGCSRQAQLTFAMARHAVVDLAQVFIRIRPLPHTLPERLSPTDMTALTQTLAAAGLPLSLGPAQVERLHELRRLYEPHVHVIADYLALQPPRWIGHPDNRDNWQRSPWDHPPTPRHHASSANPIAPDRHF